MIDELTRERLGRELRSAARQIRLEPGSELTVVKSGRKRRRRRNRLTALTAVAALGAGTVVVVAQLSQPSDDSVQIGESGGTTGDEATDEASVDEPVDAPATTVTTVIAQPEVVAPSGGQAPPAELVDSEMVWRVVEPDAAEAVGIALSARPWTGFEEGIMLSTAPGRSNDFTPMFWRTADGITWTPHDLDAPIGGRNHDQFVFDGGAVYAVGTAPGIAASAPNPLIAAWSDDDGATWHQTELPIDTNADLDVPGIRHVSYASSVHPLDGDGAIVLVQHHAGLDWDLVNRRLAELGHPVSTDFVDQDGVGVHVLADQSCVPQPTAPVVGPTTTTIATGPTEYVAGDEFGGCELRTFTWDQLGIPAEAVALARPSQRAFHVDGDSVREIELPASLLPRWYVDSGDAPLVTADDGRVYRVTADGAVEESDYPPGVWIGETATTEFAIGEQAQYAVAMPRQQIGARSADGDWRWTDWGSLAGDDSITSVIHPAVGPAGIVGVATATQDAIAVQGGVTVSADGITLSRSSLRDDPQVVIDATG